MATRKYYIGNNNPIFVKPKKDKRRPAFIRFAMKRAAETDVARNELNYTIQPRNPVTGVVIPRFRRLNEHRARAMRAMVQAMLHHFNISSDLVMASVEQLSDECNLSTVSKAGNKSITRASRLITKFMEPMGFVKCKKIWDRIMGMYIPKMITLTPLFFMLFGITKEKLKNAKKQQLGWINSELIKQGKSKITFTEARRRAKEQHIKRAFSHRKNQYFLKKQKKIAKRIIRLEEKTARQQILRDLIKRYTVAELTDMGHVALRKQVNIEYFRLKKIINL